MKSTFGIRTFALAALSSVVLAGCGGGDGGSAASGGIGGTGVAYGTVTDFGSIVVNGRHLDDSAASVKMDDNPSVSSGGNHGGLKKGMVVRVSGDIVSGSNAGTATTVTYRDNLEGPVCNKSTGSGVTTLRVLGQTVILNGITIDDSGNTVNPANLAVNDIVEVSGTPDNAGVIHATYIEKKIANAAIEVKGKISSLAAGGGGTQTFSINALTVTVNGSTVIDNSLGTLANNQFVEVKGTTYACGASVDTLTATSVEYESEGAGSLSDNSYAEVEGIVSTVTGSNFTIGSQQVTTNGSTLVLPKEFTTADIVVGAKLEAEGTLSGGVLTARKISFRQNVRLQSTVATTPSSTSFTLDGFPGIVVSTNSATDTSNAPAITVGAFVEVRGYEGPGNTVLAARITNGSGGGNGTRVFLRGPVDSKVGDTVTILGIPVTTTSGMTFRPSDDKTSTATITQATFLGSIEKGTLVKFRGQWNGSSIAWEEAELED